VFKKWIILSIVSVTLLLLWVFVSIAGTPGTKRDKDILRLAAKNILFSNGNKAEILKDVITEQLDIIFFLEYNGKNICLKDFYQQGFKPVVLHPRCYTHGILLLAKKELEIEGSIHSSPADGLCRLPFAVARLHHRNATLALFGVHIPPPTKRCGTERQPTLDYFASLVKNGCLVNNIGAAKKRDPVVLLGDFNTISFESALDTLYQSGLEDAYTRHQWRLGPTWSQPTWFPAVFRLDFILVSRHLETTGAWNVHIKGSDHRGVVVDVLLR
jgi:endonuclease/exonuclease/phosphatase family metal-dependent hydrolase